MPVFGKGGRGSARFLGKEVRRAKGVGRRSYHRVREEYGGTGNAFPEIGGAFPLIFGRKNQDFIGKRMQEKTGKVQVLDWGCGKAVAVQEIQHRYGNRVETTGFSKDSYNEWERVKNTRLIHESKEYLLRMIPDESLDLIYSYNGLLHLFPGKGEGREKIAPAVDYISQLFQKVATGGKLVFNIDPFSRRVVLDTLRSRFRGKAVVKLVGNAFYLTKKGR